MPELKRLKLDLIPQALNKAERYRLLSEPRESESICLDILDADPENQDALEWLLLSLTDQIQLGRADAARAAKELLPRLRGDYERAYYAGVIAERTGKSHFMSGRPRSAFTAHEFFVQAMELYERAEQLSADDNDDAKLRWNSCARILESNPDLRPEPEEEYQPITSE